MQLQRTAILRIELILLPFALEILMNTKDQLIAEIEEYMHHIIWAHDCFDAYMSILDCGKEYYDEICLSNTFFTITRYSLISSLLMELTKLFDQREQTGIAELIIELIVCGGHVGSGEIPAKLLAYSVELVHGNLRVEAQKGCFHNLRQYALFFACASSAVGQFFLHLRIWVTAEDIIIEGLCC